MPWPLCYTCILGTRRFTGGCRYLIVQSQLFLRLTIHDDQPIIKELNDQPSHGIKAIILHDLALTHSRLLTIFQNICTSFFKNQLTTMSNSDKSEVR